MNKILAVLIGGLAVSQMALAECKIAELKNDGTHKSRSIDCFRQEVKFASEFFPGMIFRAECGETSVNIRAYKNEELATIANAIGKVTLESIVDDATIFVACNISQKAEKKSE